MAAACKAKRGCGVAAGMAPPVDAGTRGRTLAPAGLALAVLSVSFAAPLFRLADAPALTASFWRLAFAVLLLLPFTRGAWGDWRRLEGRDWAWLGASGVALGAHFALWVSSLFHTTVAASVTLVTLQAVFVALGGHFLLRDRLGAIGWAGVLIASAGAMAIGGSTLLGQGLGEARRPLLGAVLAVLGGVGSAVYMLIGRRLRPRLGLVAYVTPVYAAAALALLAALPLLDQPLTTGLPPRSVLLFVLLAAVPMLGGHTMANWCLRHMQAHVVATWILLEPVGAALLAWLLPALHEVPSWGTVAGGALVLVGAALTVHPAARAAPGPGPVPMSAGR